MQFSMAAVKPTMAPPANGSTKTLGRGMVLNQALTAGTHHVLPPGYLNGLN